MTALELLPVDRTWPSETERIGQALADLLGAAPAALYLVFRCPGQPWATQAVLDAAIDHGWGGLCASHDLSSESRLTAEQNAVMDLVASLCGQYEVDLERVLLRLGPETMQAFVDAAPLAGAR